MKRISPMKAQIGSLKDLDRTDVIFEPKLDGIRALCYVGKELTFVSRNDRDITKDYPEFTVRDLIHARSAILDGEIVVLDKELSPRFSLWQKGYPAVYVVFDILMLNGKLLLDVPLLERKKILEQTVTDGPPLEKIFYTIKGRALWDEIIKRSMEGVMAKVTQSLYYPGARSAVWLKVKAYKTLEAVIMGYTRGKRGLASLAVGIYDETGTLNYVGKVGTGFSEAFLRDLLELLKPLELDQPPVKGIKPVKPEFVCEIKYLEFTHGGIIRSPVFLRMRPDKSPKEVTFKDQS